MAPSLFPSRNSYPWSSSSSKDSSSKSHLQTDASASVKISESMATECGQSLSVYPGSTPLPMHGSNPHGRLSSSAETKQETRGVSVSSLNTNRGPAPVNAPYGVIGSNIITPHAQSRRGTENQLAPVTQKQAASIGAQSNQSINLGREGYENRRDVNSQIPVTSLSVPPFNTSFFPLFGPPGTRQGFIMPRDWAINSSGFLVSENARRLNATALEADKIEHHRRASSERPRGPAAGCRMCAVVPRVMLFPCEHRVCSECGSRFMTASGGMYCSCGELVSSMINLNVPHAWDLQPSYYLPVLHQQSYPPPGLPVQSINLKEAQSVSPLIPVPSKCPSAAVDVLTLAPRPVPQRLTQYQSGGQKPVVTTTVLTMDAETAIENAPFIELGRHALAQNWCCVKISNIPYSVTVENILEFLGKNAKVVPNDIGIPVHIIMDRASGKTMDAFVEFTCPKDAYRCVTRKRGKILGARHVLLDVVNQEDLMKEIFPRARGVTWEGVIPKVVNVDNGTCKADIVTKEELVLIVGHARTPHRSPFSRKCLQRPYEAILSIVAKFPWFAVTVYTIHQRDIIFQALLSTIDILKRQCKRGRTTPNLDTDLLKKLCKAGVLCSGFTNKQKREVIRIGEFGAETLIQEVEEDIRGFEGLVALSKKRGADGRFEELFGMLSTLHANHHQATTSNTPETSDPEKQTAISRLPSALIDELDEPRYDEKHISNRPIFRIGTQEALSEQELEARSKYSMAEMAEHEWAAIEKYVRAVLPARAHPKEVLLPRQNNVKTNDKVAT